MADFQKPKSDFEREMMQLESEIRRLEAEFNMFFAGRLPRPPWETRARVAALVKKTDNSFIRNTADRFRFESLQNRYAKFLELWERQMTNRELGRPIMGAKRPEPPPAKKPAPVKEGEPAKATAKEKERPETGDPGLIRFKRDQETNTDTDRVKQLYQQLTDAKKQAGETPVPLDRVAALVKAQVDKFKSEGQDVTFKVAVKDGKVSLTVKPVKDE
ncbi:MAG TPA: MXAN_5187 C-terminal domain-containing protein [Vicinamibacterales bacterium]|nr:MXAN_5187 C-terminal domain-containing protein [Vicinamibacterales bacterium]